MGSVADHYRPAQLELLRFIPVSARRVLVLGGCNGAFGATVKEHTGAEVWGIEFDDGAAQRASALVDHVLAGPVDEQVDELPDGHFDVVVCDDTLERLVDPLATLTRLRDKLAPDGAMVAAVPNFRYLPALSQVLLRKDFPQEDVGTFDRTYLRFFTRRSIKRLFKKAGFKVQRTEGLHAWRGTAGVVLAVVTLGYFADGLYLQYACVATPAAQRRA
ncbi:MAG: class I SAM-dependent methyltransferase [Mycobacterium sp.]|uniref:class I SAM-dependent methyltransferase n=1 Tax=Mycobacterium sp. TaxID=1785 RepID=UPI001ECDDAF6|nr:class I SAM-dependent methyltransferase [Mycobacterium sp.]MBW0017754.1 class I SAM-dependent methyltransferase [Mycobacterium sp.]